jgi:ribonuclease-3
MSSTPSEHRQVEREGLATGQVDEEEPAAGHVDGEELPAGQAEQGFAAEPLRPMAELEEATGYVFKDKECLQQALVHKSYLHQVPDYYLGCNERLEFLGDAVLGLIVSAELFRSRPDISEGRLTALRGALVRKNTLAEVAAPFMLGDYLYMSRGEEAAGGRTRASNLAHAVEAILGAVYIDGGLDAAVDVWHRLLGEHDEERLLEVLRGDYKSQLQQLAQAELKLTPHYRLVGTMGPEHSKLFQVEVLVGDRVLSSGIGRNKQIAEQAAAETAWHDLLEETARAADSREIEESAPATADQQEHDNHPGGEPANGTL